MCVLPTSWVVYFLAGLTFLVTWLFFALLNITSPILAHHHHDYHQNQSSHLDHCHKISQSQADTLLLVNASIFGYNLLIYFWFIDKHQSHLDDNDHQSNPQNQVLASLLLVSDQPGWAGAVFGWIFAGFLVAVIAVIIGRWEVTH